MTTIHDDDVTVLEVRRLDLVTLRRTILHFEDAGCRNFVIHFLTPMDRKYVSNDNS